MSVLPLQTSVAISVTALLWAAPPATAGEREATAALIAGLESQYSQTFVTGDQRAADRLLAEDFMGFGSSGKRSDKASMLAEVRHEPHQTSARITSVTVRVHGDTAIALGAEDDTSPGSKPGSNDVSHRVWLDTWRRTSAGWTLVASAEVAPTP